MSVLQAAVLVLAAFGGGALNAIAGGGTLLTFPALVLLGTPTVTANATSTIALLPGGAASMAGYRHEVAAHREWLTSLVAPSVLGGALGSVLLLRTPEAVFARLAPFLVLFATLLFMAQSGAARWSAASPTLPRTPLRWAGAWAFQLGVAVYGGYFGAGIGILMLVVLGFLGLRDIHAMNGLKNFFGICINGVAACWFVLQGAVDWRSGSVMVLGAVAGGYAGARFARRIGQRNARAAVVVVGWTLALALLLRQR